MNPNYKYPGPPRSILPNHTESEYLNCYKNGSIQPEYLNEVPSSSSFPFNPNTQKYAPQNSIDNPDYQQDFTPTFKTHTNGHIPAAENTEYLGPDWRLSGCDTKDYFSASLIKRALMLLLWKHGYEVPLSLLYVAPCFTKPGETVLSSLCSSHALNILLIPKSFDPAPNRKLQIWLSGPKFYCASLSLSVSLGMFKASGKTGRIRIRNLHFEGRHTENLNWWLFPETPLLVHSYVL